MQNVDWGWSLDLLLIKKVETVGDILRMKKTKYISNFSFWEKSISLILSRRVRDEIFTDYIFYLFQFHCDYQACT